MKWFLLVSLLLNVFLGTTLYRFYKANVYVEIKVSFPYQFQIIEKKEVTYVFR